jgi:hypothetical protein
MGFDLRNTVLEICHEEAQTLMPDLVQQDDLQALCHETWKLEVVVGRLSGMVGGHVLDVFKTLVVDLPNENHLLLAMHLAQGGLQITLNFDEGIELAYGMLAGTLDVPEWAPAGFREALLIWRSRMPRFPSSLISVASEVDF